MQQQSSPQRVPRTMPHGCGEEHCHSVREATFLEVLRNGRDRREKGAETTGFADRVGASATQRPHLARNPRSLASDAHRDRY
jgi:hypothetical protein